MKTIKSPEEMLALAKDADYASVRGSGRESVLVPLKPVIIELRRKRFSWREIAEFLNTNGTKIRMQAVYTWSRLNGIK